VTQLELLRFVLAALEHNQIPYAIVGSFASGVWGEPRMTLDLDLVVQLQARQLESIISSFPAPDFYLSRAAIQEAIGHFRPFNVIHPASGGKVDFMVVPAEGWPAEQLRRRRAVQLLPDCEGFVAAPEDVILGKLIYFQEGGSDKHLRDIAGIVKIQGDRLDRAYLEAQARVLGVHELWTELLAKLP